MGTMRPEITELECCPQCAGRVVEALDAAGRATDRDEPDGYCGCGCGDDCVCAQADSCSSIPSG